MAMTDLVIRKAELLAELEKVNQAIDSLKNGGSVEIRLRRNIRNSGHVCTTPTYKRGNPDYALVFGDPELTKFQETYMSSGWISAEDAAMLRSNGWVDGDLITFVDASKHSF